MTLRWHLVVSCEHASAAVPPELDLGVGPDVLASHVAWDPGARELAIAVAERLDAPLFLGGATRLVADLNRSPENPEVVPEVAFGVEVPGNRGLDAAARQERLARYHTPYWSAVRTAVDRALTAGARVLHLSVHSFTPELAGVVRPMSLGVMFDPDRALERALAASLLDTLRARAVHAAENGPYDGRADALVTALRPGRPASRYAGVEVELNQRHLGEVGTLAAHLVAALEAAMSDA